MSSGGSASGIRAGRAFVVIDAIDRTKSVLVGIQRRMDSIASRFLSMGKTVTAAGAALAAPLAAGAASFIQFDDLMRELQTKSAGTTQEFKALEDQARRLGTTTRYSAIEVARLQVELGKAGFNRKEIKDQTQGVLDLAQAVGEDLASVTPVVTGVLRQFQLESGETTRVVDALMRAANGSTASVVSIGESMAYVGPIARTVNMELEETLGIVAALDNLGIKGSMAGTTLRKLITRGSIETKKIDKLLGPGSATDAAGNLLPVLDILENIGNRLEGMGTATSIQTLKEIFGQFHLAGAAALANPGQSITRIKAAMANLGNTARNTAKIMEGGPGGAWRRFKGAIVDLGISIGETLNVFTPLIQKITQTVKVVSEFLNQHPMLVRWFGIIVAHVLALGAGLLAVAAGFVAISTIVGIVTTALPIIAAMLSPVGLGIVTAISGLALLGGAFLEFTDNGQAVMASLKSGFSESWNGMIAIIEEGRIEAAVDFAFTRIMLMMLELRELMAKTWDEIVQDSKLAWAVVKFGIDPIGSLATVDEWANGEQTLEQNVRDFGIGMGKAVLRAKLDMLKEGPGIMPEFAPEPPAIDKAAGKKIGDLLQHIIPATAVDAMEFGSVETAQAAVNNRLIEVQETANDLLGEAVDILDDIREQGEDEGVEGL